MLVCVVEYMLFTDYVCILLQIGEGTCLSVAIQALSENDSLWQKYLEDFTHQKLHLEYGNTGTGHKILRAAFGKLEKREAFLRLSILHVYVHIHKLNLAKVVSILRPLDKIEVAVSVFPSLSEKIHNPAHSFLHDVQDSGDFLGRPEALSVFIIDTLFGAIAGIGMSCHETSKREKNAEGEKTVQAEEAEKRVEREKSTEGEKTCESEEAETISGSDEGEKTAESEKGDVEQLKLWFKVYRDVVSQLLQYDLMPNAHNALRVIGVSLSKLQTVCTRLTFLHVLMGVCAYVHL